MVNPTPPRVLFLTTTPSTSFPLLSFSTFPILRSFWLLTESTLPLSCCILSCCVSWRKRRGSVATMTPLQCWNVWNLKEINEASRETDVATPHWHKEGIQFKRLVVHVLSSFISLTTSQGKPCASFQKVVASGFPSPPEVAWSTSTYWTRSRATPPGVTLKSWAHR